MFGEAERAGHRRGERVAADAVNLRAVKTARVKGSRAHKRLIMGFKRAAPPPPPPASYYDSLMGFMGLDSPPPATLIDDVKN